MQRNSRTIDRRDGVRRTSWLRRDQAVRRTVRQHADGGLLGFLDPPVVVLGDLPDLLTSREQHRVRLGPDVLAGDLGETLQP